MIDRTAKHLTNKYNPINRINYNNLSLKFYKNQKQKTCVIRKSMNHFEHCRKHLKCEYMYFTNFK